MDKMQAVEVEAKGRCVAELLSQLMCNLGQFDRDDNSYTLKMPLRWAIAVYHNA